MFFLSGVEVSSVSRLGSVKKEREEGGKNGHLTWLQLASLKENELGILHENLLPVFPGFGLSA